MAIIVKLMSVSIVLLNTNFGISYWHDIDTRALTENHFENELVVTS